MSSKKSESKINIDEKDLDLGQGLKYPTDKIERLIHTDTLGEFVIKPFEQTYATTIGNSLRRVLLTSIRGFAPVWIRIDGVSHIFATLPGIREDVIRFIANLKKVNFRSKRVKTFILKIEEKGPKEVTAKDIKGLEGLKILNPDVHLLTLNESANVQIEFCVETGRGFVTDDENKATRPGLPLNTLFVDSVFSPVIKVSYKVEPLVIGSKFNYEKLIIRIQTNGTASPDDALIYSANILRKNFALLGDLEAYEEEEEIIVEVKDPEMEELKGALNITVNELEMSVRSSNCLRRAGINNVLDLVQRTETDMLQTKNFGKKSLEEMKNILDILSKKLTSGIKLSFGMKEFLIAKGIVDKDNIIGSRK